MTTNDYYFVFYKMQIQSSIWKTEKKQHILAIKKHLVAAL